MIGLSVIGTRPFRNNTHTSTLYSTTTSAAAAAALRVDDAIGRAARMTKYARKIGDLSASALGSAKL